MEQLFLDQPFKLLRANNRIAELSMSQIHIIKDIYARYLFQNASDDLLTEYTNEYDIQQKIELIVKSECAGAYMISFLSVRCSGILASNTCIFVSTSNFSEDISTSFNTLVLVRASNNSLLSLLLQTLQGLELDYPLVIKDIRLSESFIKNTTDTISLNLCCVTNPSEIIGGIELTYQLSELVTGDSLRNIIINVPEKDVQHLMDKDGLLHSLAKFLQSNTQINFSLLPLTKVSCDMFTITQDGRLQVSSLKLHRLQNIHFEDPSDSADLEVTGQNITTSQSEIPSLVWFFLRSIYKENL